MVPWSTGSGEAVFTIETSAWVGDATTVVEVAVLLAGVTSFVVGATPIVLEIVVPGAVPVPTFTTIGKLTAVPPTGNVAPEQLAPDPGQQEIGPVPPTAGSAVQIHPLGIANETSAVFVGTDPVNVTPLTVAGPLSMSVCVYVTLLPGRTGFGEAELVTARSYWPAEATTTFAVAELFPGLASVTLEETLAVSEITVPEGVVAFTLSWNVKVAVALAARVPVVAVIVPVPPIDGVLHDHPEAHVNAERVAYPGEAGIDSV